MALPQSGFNSKVFWDSTKTTLRGTNGISGGTTAITEANIVSLCVAANEIGYTEDEFPVGEEPATENRRVRGRSLALSLPIQPTSRDIAVPLLFDFDSTIQEKFVVLEPGTAIAMVLVQAYEYGGPLEDAFPSDSSGDGKINKYIAFAVEGRVAGKMHVTPVEGFMMTTVHLTQSTYQRIKGSS